jgi:phosphoglycerate kinase
MIMSFSKLTIRDTDSLSEKRVLVRVDFNVPIHDNVIIDDTRILSAVPTIEYLLAHGARVILISHLGRPTEYDILYSLRPVATHLAQLTGRLVRFIDNCAGIEVETQTRILKPGEILLLENLRFHKGEEENDIGFAQRLAKLGDIYVNDAFGIAHCPHASVEAITHYLPTVAGLLVEKEINFLTRILTNRDHPFIALVGGAKIRDKLPLITSLLSRVDRVLVGGGIANTFLKAQGYEVGESLVDNSMIEQARDLLDSAGDKLILPMDVNAIDVRGSSSDSYEVAIDKIEKRSQAVDIGRCTIVKYRMLLQHARVIVWNGPLGVFEIPEFAIGTNEIAKAIIETDAISVVGGGHSVAALRMFGVDHRITHLSTGGGAMLEFLKGKILPGIAVIPDIA